MQILAGGFGQASDTIVRPENPQRRDVQMMSTAMSDANPSYLLTRRDADNPGV
jgi:hypothetical protein